MGSERARVCMRVERGSDRLPEPSLDDAGAATAEADAAAALAAASASAAMAAASTAAAAAAAEPSSSAAGFGLAGALATGFFFFFLEEEVGTEGGWTVGEGSERTAQMDQRPGWHRRHRPWQRVGAVYVCV